MIQLSDQFGEKSDNERYFGIEGNSGALMYLSVKDKASIYPIGYSSETF